MPVMLTGVNEATARVLCKAGCSVAAPKTQVCCGALHAHSGALDQARELAKTNIETFENWEAEHGALDAIVINAAGCGAALKEYPHWFHDVPEWKARAEKFSGKVQDVSEFLNQEQYRARLEALMPAASSPAATAPAPADVVSHTVGATSVRADNGEIAERRENWTEAVDANKSVSADEATSGQRPQPPHSGAAPPAGLENDVTSAPRDVVEDKQPRATTRLTYHDACHLAHGQGVRTQPRELLDVVQAHAANTEVVPLGESEMCCGSAGIYNITQPEMAMRLLERKMKHIAKTGAQVVVTGNPGCAMQIMLGAKKFGTPVEVLHPVEVLDAATGGSAGERR
jgi:glycolate oxidase iron-sulfur subunit